jgi:hypothetical protein
MSTGDHAERGTDTSPGSSQLPGRRPCGQARLDLLALMGADQPAFRTTKSVTTSQYSAASSR